MANSGFPSFESMFGPEQHYLPLLHLGWDNDVVSLRPVITALRSAEDPVGEIVALLQSSEGWRIHLVGAVAAVLAPRSPEIASALWHAFDNNTWVTPQVVAVAWIVDPEFEVNARNRIERLCRDLEKAIRPSPDPKDWAALVTMAKRIRGSESWLAPCVAHPVFCELMAKDDGEHGDNGAGLADRWLDRLLRGLKQIGVDPPLANRAG